MKTAIFTLLFALLTQTSDALSDSQLSCGNSKIFVKVKESITLIGKLLAYGSQPLSVDGTYGCYE